MDLTNTALLVFGLWLVYDRLRSTFFEKTYHGSRISVFEYLFSALMVAFYICVVFSSVFSLIKPAYLAKDYFFIIAGIVLFLSGRQMRTLAIHTLGRNWGITTSASNVRRVIHIGPYHYSRHPYYLSTCLELAGFVLAGRSLAAFLILLFLYIPVSIYRAIREEEDLLRKFPEDYKKYKWETPAVFNWRRFTKKEFSNAPAAQIYRLLTHYGLRHILSMSYVHGNILKHGRGYMLSHCMGALFEVGFIAELEEKGEVHLNEFSDRTQLSPYYLRSICDYLFILGLLNRQGQVYFFSRKGARMVKEAKGVFSLLYAYSPVFENLVPLLRQEREYGRDVCRRGKYVAKGSAEIAAYLPFPEAKRIIEKHNIKKVLDLGCGSADFLINLCSRNQLLGFGIDVDQDAVQYAGRRVEQAGMVDRIQLSLGDIFKLGELPQKFRDVEALTCMFVLHEFLYKGIDTVTQILEGIKSVFPGRFLLVIELCRQSSDQLRGRPSGIAEHHLFHAISKQGFASFHLWQRIFKACGFTTVEERRFDFSEQGYFLLKS